MDDLISQEDAIEHLRLLCEQHGGIGIFAKKLGVDISAVSHQLNGHRPIQGKVAQYMGLQVCREITLSYKKAPA